MSTGLAARLAPVGLSTLLAALTVLLALLALTGLAVLLAALLALSGLPALLALSLISALILLVGHFPLHDTGCRRGSLVMKTRSTSSRSC